MVSRSKAIARPPNSFQGAFFAPPWGGWSDFLIRVEKPSALGAFSYEVVDTKLKRKPDPNASDGGFDFVSWGGGIYSGWEVVDYAAIALAESAPLMLTPGRRCENQSLSAPWCW